MGTVTTPATRIESPGSGSLSLASTETDTDVFCVVVAVSATATGGLFAGKDWLTATVRLTPIVTVPSRVVEPVFSPTRTVIGPADTVDGVVIHGWLSVTGQLQPLGPVTVTFCIPAADVKLNDVGNTLVGDPGQGVGGGDWLTATVRLTPIVTVPSRVAEPVFLPTRTVIGPADTVDGVVIHGWLSVTGQLQPLGPVTVTFCIPAADVKLNDVGDTLVGDPGQGVGGGDWLTATVRLTPIVTVPSRVAEPGFSPTRTVIGPADTVDGVVIHGWLSVTGQLQPLGPVTDTSSLPPAAAKLNDGGNTMSGEDGQGVGGGGDWLTATVRLVPIVTVPSRVAEPGFSPTRTVIGPADTVDGVVIHGWWSVTGQLQPLGPVTVTVCIPAADVKLNDIGDTLVGDAGHGSTMMGMSRPPMVTVPDLPALPEPTVTVTRSPADTLDGVVVIQAWLSLTSQLQPVGPVTDRLSAPPAAGNLNDDGVTLVGDGGHGSTVTGTSVPPIATVPDRPGGPGATPTSTVPPADTVEGVAVIQARSSLTDQLQWAGPVTVRSCVPPGHGKVNDDGVTLSGVLRQANRGTLTGISWLPIATVPDSPAWPGSTVTVTFPPVDTLVGVAVIQARSSLTGQLQPAGPVTDRRCVPPAAGNVNDDGETVVGAVGQPETCDTATELPPMATVPSRAPPGFSSAWISTESPPDTLDGVVSQTRSPLTGQLQSLRPVTLTYRTLVTAGNLNDVGDTPSGEDGQGPGGCCVTVNVAPATVRVAVRLAVPVCACAV